MALFSWWRRDARIAGILRALIERFDEAIQSLGRQSAENQHMALDLTKLIAALVRSTSATDKLTAAVKAQNETITALRAELDDKAGQTDVDSATAALVAVAEKAEAAITP